MRKRILVVEDNDELREMLKTSFRRAGFSVATAANGIEALKKARSLTPSGVLLDLVLPELDGFAVCEILRKNPQTAHVPIIILTGLTSQFSRLAGVESGATDFLTKPVGPEALISRFKRLLSTAGRG
jgi:DNA-binding response OmpR family regulator